MIWHALNDLDYQSGNYRLCHTVMGWDVWRWGSYPANLARGLRLKAAQALCEADAKAIETLANEV